MINTRWSFSTIHPVQFLVACFVGPSVVPDLLCATRNPARERDFGLFEELFHDEANERGGGDMCGSVLKYENI